MSVTLVLCLMMVLRILSFSWALSIFLSMAGWLVSSFFTNASVASWERVRLEAGGLWPVGKGSASRAGGLREWNPALPGPVIPVTETLVNWWLPCQASGVIGSLLDLVYPSSSSVASASASASLSSSAKHYT